MKFYHVSDILIGNTYESGMRWEEARGAEITGSLDKLLARADSEGVGLVLITGGLFAHQPVTKELKRVAGICAGHPGIEIVITAGLSDAVGAFSPVLSFSWPANVHFVEGHGIELIRLDALNTEIYAASMYITPDGKTESAAFRDFQTFAASGMPPCARIALIPDGDNNEIAACFDGAGFSYVAAAGSVRGVSHEIIKGNAYRPGPLEPRDTSDRGAHGAMVGEIDTGTGALCGIEFQPMALASYVTLNIGITTETTAEELREALVTEIRRRKATNIYRLRLTGEKDPDTHIDLGTLMDEYRIRELIDETEPRYDYEALYAEHAEDMIGFYINTIYGRTGSMSKLEKKAMYYGIEALLATSGRDGDT